MAQVARQREAPVPPERRACRSAAAIALFLGVSAAGLAADLVSKHLAFQSFLSNPELPARVAQARLEYKGSTKAILHAPQVSQLLQRQVLPGLRFTLSTNPGIVFGSTVIPRWAVNAATVLTVLFVAGYFGASDRSARWLHVALACIVGGAMGNLYDRLLAVVAIPGGLEPISYEVRDFIDCSQLYYPYVFNIADALLVAGVAIIFLLWFWPQRKKNATASVATGSKTPA